MLLLLLLLSKQHLFRFTRCLRSFMIMLIVLALKIKDPGLNLDPDLDPDLDPNLDPNLDPTGSPPSEGLRRSQMIM